MEREKASTILVAFNTLESANVYRVCAAVTEGALQVGVGLFSCVYHDTLTLPLCFCTRMKNLNKIKKKEPLFLGRAQKKKAYHLFLAHFSLIVAWATIHAYV